MPVIIFAWTDSTTGHASLFVDGYPDASKGDRYATYISFYPDPRRVRAEDLGLKQAFFSGVPGTPTTMAQNTHSVIAERKRVPDFASAPISGLDEKAIMDFWATFRANNPNWSLVRNSCADVVFQALSAGGAGEKSVLAKAMLALARHQYVLVRDCICMAKVLGG